MKCCPDIKPFSGKKSKPGKYAHQSLHTVQRSLLFYVNWRYLRPLLKQLLPHQIHRTVRWLRSQFQPSFYQHSPIRLQLPQHYSCISLPDSAELPIVSIVTPSFNQAQFLERTMTSVTGQRYPKLEYIIQDGGSTDGTARILKEYRPKLKHVESHKDRGQANAINLGFRHASGEIMAWLNADDLLLPGAIPYIVNFFLAHPEIDVVYGHRICIDQKDYEVGRWLVLPDAETMLPWVNYIPQETLFWRKRIWEKTGGYIDESYQFAMDWELLLRFHKAEAKFARLPRFLGAFRVHPTQKTATLETVGQREAKHLHTDYHARPVEWLEIRYRVKRYLARTAWLYLLYYMRSAKTKFLLQKLRFCTPK